LSLALVATGGALLFIDKAFRKLPIEADPVTTSTVIKSSSSGDQDQRSSAAVRSETKDAAAAPSGPTGLSGAGDEVRPAFDVARVEPSGDAVIAGRAAPGASVELLRNGTLHDRVVADASGQFAMVPPRLPPGDSELTLRSRQPDGRPATSKESVVVALQRNLKDRPVVALMTPDEPSVVLSKPVAPNSSGGSVVVETVETEPGGKLYVSGRSSPRAAVRLYLNDSYLASTTAAANGRFAFTVDGGVGLRSGYRVRLDEVESGSGVIRSRAEVPFNTPETAAASDPGLNPRIGSSQSPQGSPQAAKNPSQIAAAQEAGAASGPSTSSTVAVTAPKVPTAVVSRGDSLWRISRTAYGNGARYTVIYDANHNQIKSPDRIYPGQVFVIPEQAR
jgi:nucleoid-associated protein YgaU